MKELFKNPIVRYGAILVVLFFGGRALYRAGQKNALETEIAVVDAQLATTPAGRSGDSHIKLLAKRKALQDALAKL